MDPSEIVKQGLSAVRTGELLMAGTAVASAMKLTEFVKAMLGPAAEEVAEMFRDSVRLYRFRRQLDCLKKAETMLQNAGRTPEAVPIKLLFPLLEGASLEADEDLHTMWAALLANAAGDEEKVAPSFAAVLKQMSPNEARLLRWISEQPEHQTLRDGSLLPRKIWHLDTLLHSYVNQNAPRDQSSTTRPGFLDIESTFDALEAVQLVRRFTPRGWQNEVFLITSRGYRFLEACSPPAP